jgi:hypothetical protein
MHDERKASLDAVAMGDTFILRPRCYRNIESGAQLKAKLRHRLSKEGDLTLWYVLREVEEFLQDSWEKIRFHVGSSTELEVLEGTKKS